MHERINLHWQWKLNNQTQTELLRQAKSCNHTFIGVLCCDCGLLLLVSLVECGTSESAVLGPAESHREQLRLLPWQAALHLLVVPCNLLTWHAVFCRQPWNEFCFCNYHDQQIDWWCGCGGHRCQGSLYRCTLPYVFHSQRMALEEFITLILVSKTTFFHTACFQNRRWTFQGLTFPMKESCLRLVRK